jgi:hypothetical protein
MTFVGIGPQFTDAPYLPPEPEYTTQIQDFQEAQVKRERLTATILNIKENAQYEKRELLTGQQYFSNYSDPVAKKGAIVTNYTFRVAFDLVELNGGAIGPGLTTLVLTANTNPPLLVYSTSLIPVHFFGAATVAGPLLLPLPYASAAGNNIEIWFDITNPAAQAFNINNAYGANLTQAYAVIEYIKT